MANKERLDTLLVRRGLAPNRTRAQALILAGRVRQGDRVLDKAGSQFALDAEFTVLKPEHPYVSRGGMKLAGALEHFGLDPTGWRCLDVGASTGGFTDCLLQRGAVAVTTLDVGYGQLDVKLRNDPRVEVNERINARELDPKLAPGPYDLVTADVSFISLTLILPSLVPRMKAGGRFLGLVKPQFEAGREKVGKGGIVRDEAVRMEAVAKVSGATQELGLTILGHCLSPIKGARGNQEYLILALKPV